MQDQFSSMLTQTLSLAQKGGALVKPNPQVGAIIIRDGLVVGEGYHARYGQAHAEAAALSDAGDRAQGATLLCSLEPCSFSSPTKHQGPCTDKIITAGISEVVIGQLDPNPRVRGTGAARLSAAGIDVHLSSDTDKYWLANAHFNTFQSLGRPFVTLKLAQSLDGKIAAVTKNSRWITDEQARRDVHRLRAFHDAVLIGVGTAVTDDPRLTVRLEGEPAGLQPRPVVLDPQARIPPVSRLVRERADELLLITAAESSDTTFNHRMKELENRGVETVRLPREVNGSFSLSRVLAALAERNIRSVLVEGGAETATRFIRERLFDGIQLYIAPILIGGDGISIGGLQTTTVAQAAGLEHVTIRSINNQAVISGFRDGWLQQIQSCISREEVSCLQD